MIPFRLTHRISCAVLCALGMQARVCLAQESSPESAAPVVPAQATDVLGGMRITLFGNVLGRRDDIGFFDDQGNNLDDRVYLRSLGALLTAPVSDLGRGIVFARWTELAGERFDSQVDEAYLELDPLQLPFEALSGRVAVRAGRFRAPFGRANRLRDHELPQITRPLVFRKLLGEEGLLQTGLACAIDVPTGSERLDCLLTGEFARDFPLDEALTPFVNLALRLHAGERDWFDLGFTLDNSRDQHDFGFQSGLRGADLSFTHRPAEADAAGAFFLGGEFLRSKVALPAGDETPMGYYAWGQLEFLPHWFASARFDQSDELTDDSLTSHVLSGYLGWAVRPELRLNLGYEHTSSDDDALDGLDSLLVELNFVFGSASPGPDWLEPHSRP